MDNWLKDARERLGLSIKRTAEILGAPYATVIDWNNGRRTPPEWIQKLVVEKLERAGK